MLNDFFKLNEPFTKFTTPEEFVNHLQKSKDLRNVLYEPDKIEPTAPHPKLKIGQTVFSNVSFSKTKLERVVFINCSFEACLLIGTQIIDCEFHNCKFKNCNTYKISITRTYINPRDFVGCFNSISESNIAVHLFQQLITNSIEEGQSDFRRTVRLSNNSQHFVNNSRLPFRPGAGVLGTLKVWNTLPDLTEHRRYSSPRP